MLTRDGRDAMGRSPMQRATETDAIRLWLMFACCQPSLTKQEQVSLTLHIVGGLTTSEIARALLIPEADLVQRIEALEFKTEAVGVPILVIAGLWYRKKPEHHKRLMILATIGILPPAIARLPFAFIETGG